MDWLTQLGESIAAWSKEHETLVVWLVIGSVLVSLGGILLVPIALVRIPSDYFAHNRPPAWGFAGRHPVLRVVLLVIKNAAGVILLIAGIVMSVAPGPGLVATMLGIMMLDFPGKRRLERWIVSRPGVLRTLNALRAKAGQPPLEAPQSNGSEEPANKESVKAAD